MPFSRGSSRPTFLTSPALAGELFTTIATQETHNFKIEILFSSRAERSLAAGQQRQTFLAGQSLLMYASKIFRVPPW